MEYSPVKYGYYVFLITFVISLPTLCYAQEKSKATYYGSPDGKGTSTGACGYGEYGRTVNDGNVAAVSRLYKNGEGCGACYQIKCTEQECINKDGVTVVVTDHGVSTAETDFIISGQAFAKMAQSGMQSDLKARGHVNIEYQRVACQYPGNNLMLKVHEYSNYPNYLAMVFYNQAGVYDISAVEIFEEESQRWRACRRAYGGVWDTPNPPKGDLTVRFFARASGSSEAKWVVVPKVIPLSWRAGLVYDTSIQL